MTEIRIDELARRAGLTVDTIRFYQREGLLPPAQRAGRAKVYGQDHLARLAQIRDLQTRFETVTTMLTDLAPHLPIPCRPGAGRPDLWGSVLFLVGDDLREDGIDLFRAAETAEAWRTVFDALDGLRGGLPTGDALCRAAALLRPRERRQCRPRDER